MPKTPLKATLRDLLDVAKSEYEYLTESKAHDGFDLSKLVILDRTEEEFHVIFSLTLNKKTMKFLFCVGYDQDEDGFWPYVEVQVGDAGNPDSFTAKQVGGDRYVQNDEDLSESIELLSRNCGEARFEAFRWLEQQETAASAA